MDITRRQALFLIVGVIGALTLFIAADQFIERVSPWDYDDFERWMADLGVWGPILYILFFAASMVFAPIPTGPAPVAAAAAFGAAAGFAYTMIAGAIGASLCFGIARRWGRPALIRLLPDKLVGEIDRVAARLGARVLIALRMFPIFGTDIVSYAAGLTPLRFRAYLLITIVASSPALLLISLIGEGVQDNRALAAASTAGLGILLLLPLIYFVVRKQRSGPTVVGSPDSTERA